MNLDISEEFRSICSRIIEDSRSLDEWIELESDDMFQTSNFVGGFDADEAEFCFSYFSSTGEEYWFQVSLEEIAAIAERSKTSVEIRPSESGI